MKSNITTSFTLDTRREKQNKKFPVKLCVNHITTAKYYGVNIDLSEAEFASLSAKRLSRESSAINDQLKEIEAEAKEIIKFLKPFSFTSFSKRFSPKSVHKGTLESLFRQKIDQLTTEERLGTASNYQCSINSLLSFKEKLSLEIITVDFLNGYEKWMINKNEASITTVGIYLRPLRSIFNDAIEMGLVPRENYPFGEKKYQIPTGVNIKKALPIEEIGKFYNHQSDASPEGQAKAEAKDYWLFTYLGNGINMKDIALLKYKNIPGDYIIFERAKTQRTKRTNPKPITIYITPEMREIIERRGNHKTSDDVYVFPILEPGADAVRKRKLIQQFTKKTNKWTKRIQTELGISTKVTTYTARHSFSTVLKRSGASTEFIQEALGHSSVKTTESYLDSFENDMKKQFAANLTQFKKENVAISVEGGKE